MGILARPETMLSVYGVLFIMGTASAVTSEYQLDSQTLLPCELAREKASKSGADYIPQCSDDGLFRNIQCTRNGLSCWCVNVDGHEVPGSRRTGSPPLCLSFCQLKKQQILVSGYINRTSTSYIPQCKDSGAFESVQCNQDLGQCWCVDTEGMEIYGTRQIGKPKQCPRNCEIRDRRILHGVGEKVPPHCSDNGEFSPVQCKLVNTTDKMILDIVTSFSRFPDAFKSFTSLRESFPEISGYCYCADRHGRELANTGLELLLDEVYDTVFAGQSPSRSFTKTTIYRILQRRFLGVQLITSGKFRCPTTCEVQRFTDTQMGGVYIPSCTENGDFEAVQCQTGGQCWCVDSKGREIYGSRLQGKLPNCNNYQDCSNRRRQALSSLFYRPTGHFGQRNLFGTQEEEFGPRLGSKHCSSYVLETFVNSGLLNPIDEKFGDKKTKTDNFISDMVTGLFPSRDLIQLALKFTKDPKRFQQNLFGGKYLKNMGSFNFTGAVGVRSKFNFSGFFQQIGLTGMYSGGNFKELAKLFSSEEDSYLTKDSSNFSKQSFNLNQPIQASFGQIVNLQENQNLVTLFVSILELEEFSKLLREVVSVPPKISEDVSETVKIVLQSKACPRRDTNVFVPTCTEDGRYDEIQCSISECWCVDDSGEEIEGSRTRGKKARCPTKCEKERDLQTLIKKSLPAGSETFIPSCDRNGNFWTVQCIGKKCFCVDFDGQIIPGTQKLSGENIQCPSNCQLTASKEFLRTSGELLSGSRTVSQLSEVFIPQCSEDGDWKPVQCSGPTEQTFELYQAWTTLNRNISFSETLRIILTYKKTSSQSFRNFVLALYTNGHQNVFPSFSKYSSFSVIPEDVLGGNITVQTDNVLLNPYLLWRILSGDLTYYPGAYSDFSVNLNHFDLRTCWCVDPNGQKIQGSEVMPNKVPKCPGRCEIAKVKSLQFAEEAENLIEASNTSHFPFGQSFLLANGIRLSEMDLLHADGSFKSGVTFSESFMNRDNYHLQLAAQSTLHFYWRRRSASFGETTQSAYVPYVPQCDELGEWEPVQFYESTGHYWCVDEDGNYIPDSLVTRTSRPPQCHTSCQRSQLNALIASWIPQSFQSNSSSVPESLIPRCTETGQYTPLPNSETDFGCMLPMSKDEMAQGMNGSNNCPLCPFPFSSKSIKHGTVFCEEVMEGGLKFQKCQLKCRKGYHNVIPSETFLCDLNSRVWVSQPPHPQSCQRVSSFQTVQTEVSFELLLPSSKTCMADYSGLLQAFRTFILDDLKARGLCHIQVNYFGNRGLGTVPVCDDSTVHVECLSTDRLGVNVTWRAQLENIQVPSLPSLHDIEKAIVGENLIGRFLSIIKTGNYTLNLDSKLFIADTTAFFPRDEDFSVSPQINLGCKDGFQKISNSDEGTRNLGGCVICPPGTSAQEGCRPCPKGSYQENAGSPACMKCPLGTTTAYSGAYKKSQCETRCQMNTVGLLCDDKGRYLPSQKDETMKKYYCVDVSGEKLTWTEVDSKLTNDQCLALRRFQLVSEDKIILLTDEDSVKIKSKRIDGQKEKYLDCFMDCAMEESCDYLSVSTNGSQTVCEQYSGDEPNIICTTTKQMQGVLGNAASASMEGLTCRFKIKPTSTNSLTVYRKKGHESPEIGLGIYENTEFGNTVSGVYNTSVFSAEDASLTDALSFCRQTCRRDPCCNGFILSQVILNRGTILCGLLSSPDVLLCHVNDWSETSTLGGDGVCKGVRSNKEQKTFSFYLGGQEFTGSYSLLSKSLGKVEYSTELTTEVKEEIQRVFITFQRVFLLRDPDKKTLAGDSGCRPIDGLVQASIVSDSVMELFVPVESDTVTVDKEASLAKQQYWISKQRYSSKQATQWCLTRCKEEESWCRLADLQDSTKEYFTCIIYPETRKCSNTNDLVPDRCDIALNSNPQLLHSRKEILGNKVKHFYTNLPYRKLTEISVRNKISMTGKSVSNGFFECELQCDADPCCKGFGYLQRSRLTGSELLCLTLGSLGIQSCSGTDSSSWRVTDCSTGNEGMESHPFGWFQKPEDRQSFTSALCPATDVSIKEKEGLLDDWQLLDASSVSIDSSLTDYDSVQISRDSPKTIEIAQNYCISVCSRAQSCVTATVEVLQTKVRCLFYPETQSCYHNLNKHQCSVLVKEPATYIFRKKVSTRSSVTISSGGSLFGKSQAIQIGSDLKNVNQFLGIPYAAPPVGDNRFRPPQPYNWTGTWNATTTRSSCLQPGDGKAQYGSVSEDCLYLNVFVPYNTGTGKATLLYFHNSPSDYSENGQTFVDGSYMAAVGDIIVVTASYRVGVFGFLSTGNTTPSGNWGLFDQAAALKWVHENIGHFGGDAGVVSIAADRAGADIASIHLLLADTTAFKRALLMGGSAFSPMLVISERSAQDQVRFLANEVRCLASNNEDVVSCLRKMAADTLNAAQTKLLAQRGPFQTWGPVVDGVYIRDKPSTLIQKEIPRNIDLFIGSAEQDGLIVRAKAIKRFEESQGRADSKMAFYQALQNSLGGEERNLRVQDAAVWFYSLQHSTDDYSGFSRALENSTRDHFIACPAIKMANYWSEHSKGRVFMYYVPESFSQSSTGLDLPEDVIYAFGLPFHSNYKNQFSIEEQNLSLKIMRYVTNFVKTGNPNFQYTFTRKLMRDLPVWPQYLGSNNGDNYKKFSVSLSNSQGLKKAECSFWNDYIPLLKSTTGSQSEILPTKNSIGGIFKTVTSPSGPKPEKEAYN